MKRYKILKDLPFAKAGEILELWSDGTMAFVNNPNLPRFNKKDVEMFPLWFKEIKSFEVPDEFEMGFWTIMYGEDGFCTWFLSSDGHEEDYEKILKHHMEVGWAFETEQKAEEYLEWLKARAVLIEDTNGFKPNWNDEGEWKYYVSYNHKYSTIEVSSMSYIDDGEIFFKTEEDAGNSIKRHEKEWKIYLGIEKPLESLCEKE